jgi:hypothetical protein
MIVGMKKDAATTGTAGSTTYGLVMHAQSCCPSKQHHQTAAESRLFFRTLHFFVPFQV